MDRDTEAGICILILVVIGVGLFINTFMQEATYKELAIKNNCAYYDAKSGGFTWRESK